MSEEALISATLIVRDEEAHLGACLDSLRAIADDIVVVDTGSRDASRSIAAAHEARVFDFHWRDDFSAARNHAIDQATGDWILYVDADERVRTYDRRVLAAELADRSLCAATVRFHPQAAYRELRLFRRDPRIRFRSAIHETIVPDTDQIVAAGAGHIGASQFTIDHLGYDGDQSAKDERDLPLLLKQVQVDPGRVYLWWHLGVIFYRRGRPAEAEAAWWQGAEAARSAAKRRAEEVLCFIELAKLRLTRGENALALIREATALQPRNWLLQWLKARALMLADHYDEAAPIFERLACVDAETLLTEAAYDERIFGASALDELGYWAFRLGRYRDCEELYRRAEMVAPDRRAFRFKRELAARRAHGGGRE